MCGGGEGKPITYKEIMPPWQQDVAKQLAELIGKAVSSGTGATQLPGGFPLAAPPSPMLGQAGNILQGMAGYKPQDYPPAVGFDPGFYPSPGYPGGGGQLPYSPGARPPWWTDPYTWPDKPKPKK